LLCIRFETAAIFPARGAGDLAPILLHPHEGFPTMSKRNRGSHSKPLPARQLPGSNHNRLAPPMQQAMQQAVAAYSRGAWANAEQLCRLILNTEPRHFDALHLLGIIAARTGRSRDAADLLKLAVATNPDSATVHNNYGNVLKDLKRFGDALGSYDRALKINADLAEVHNNRAVTLYELGRFADAVDGTGAP
jgi:protein O-GlcNAc transferase